MKKIRTAIVGCGKVGQIHARSLAALTEAEFVAVCDINIDRAREIADLFGVSSYSTVEKMIENSQPEAVIVCTPHPVHVDPTTTALRMGVHVLVEKPLAATLADCDAMILAAQEAGVKLGVVSQRRLYPPALRVKEAIEAGKIGKPVLGVVMMLGWRDGGYYQSDPWRGTWEGEGGGVLVNQAPHQLDLLQWYMGPIEELFGYHGNLNHPEIEVEDTAIATIRFKNGGLGSILVSNSQKPGLYGKVHIHGENGSSVGVQTDGGAMFIAGMSEVLEPPKNDLWTIPGEQDHLDKMAKMDAEVFTGINISEHFLRLQDQDFLQAVLENRPPLVTGKQGRVSVEIFSAIYRSHRDRCPVKFPVGAQEEGNDFDSRMSISSSSI